MAISLGFAANFKLEGFVQYTSDEQIWNLKIKNVSGHDIERFKIYHYLDYYRSYEKYPNPPYSKSYYGNVIDKFRRVSADYARQEFDFNGKIAAGTTYPSKKNEYIQYAARNLRKETPRTESLPLDDYVIVTWSGKLLYGDSSRFYEPFGVYSSYTDGSNHNLVRIGGLFCGSDHVVFDFFLDTEDKNDKTRIDDGKSDYLGSRNCGVSIKNTGIEFNYSYDYVRKLPRIAYDYAVLRLDYECPENGIPFSRYHDNEDKNNRNSYSMDIWPNVIGSNATLEYCFVEADSKSKVIYPPIHLGSDFAFFANPPSSIKGVERHVIEIDDEDSNNRNSWNYYGAESRIVDRIKKIMDGSHNTTMHVVTRNYSLDKSAMTAASANNSNSTDNSYVVATPLAPAIKGLDRSAVAVELKSAGDVKISIVNVNGAQVVSVVEKNLQLGVHQIKWNTEKLSNGRYVVKIEQNGMVNAKNIILK